MDSLHCRIAQRAFEAIPGYATVQNKQFQIVAANDAFRKDFGAYEGRCCYQVYKQRPEKCEDCPVERTFHDGQPHRSEEVVTTLSGKKVWVLVNTTPILNGDGEVSEVIEMSTDITQMKQLQTQLKESQNRYYQLFEEVPCFISIQDRDFNIVDANRAHRETFGAGYGRKCYEVYKHREKACLPCTVEQTFKDGRSYTHEEVVTSDSGKSINVLVHTAPLLNSAGGIDKVIEMSIDITQLRELQDKLTSVGLLISTISHGIKGLLNGLNSGIYLINSGQEKGDQARIDKGWDITMRNIRRIKSMVMDILYYAKDREPNWEELSAGEIVKDVCSTMADRARSLNVELASSINGSGKYEGDRQMIRSMLVNLVENSIDACRIDSAKQSHKITVELNDIDDGIQFIIADNGIGMDRETREKAFSLFFSSKGAGGTGLGLFIAHKITNSHGGTIRVESEEGKGSQFLVELPRERPHNQQSTDEPASNP